MNIFRTRRFTCVWMFVVVAVCLGAEAPTRAPLPLKNPLQDKNFYVLSMIEQTPAVRTLVESNAVLGEIGKAKRAALAEAVRSCAPAAPAGGPGPGGGGRGGTPPDIACYTKALRWTDEEIARSRAALGALGTEAALRQLVEGPVRQSGLYQRYSDKPPAALLEQAWEDAARKMNLGIDRFALGGKLDHEFDGPAYDVKSPEFSRMVQSIAAVLNNDPKSLELFFQPSMQFTLELLRAQLRDEAGRHEPMEAGENRAAVKRVPTVRWENFPYTVILARGVGPERPDVALDPRGRLRMVSAVKAFREGKAPFIVVSGGYVHPPLTHYNEAIEMKRSLMTEFKVPEDAIIVDPHARLTVTNLRNCVRLIYRYGIPFEKKALSIESQSQAGGVGSDQFMDRYIKRYGYAPFRVGARISPFELELIPLIDSLNMDNSDLLDP